ncbi:hypothetical protein BaRGS_00003060 [Batillaria attramentaria]|uniref:Uncharacterized protein n=1 Tax=Batillaria attramentaria TaxID=370345 RepID=A0ABD0M1J7_9CAEN
MVIVQESCCKDKVYATDHADAVQVVQQDRPEVGGAGVWDGGGCRDDAGACPFSLECLVATRAGCVGLRMTRKGMKVILPV